MKKRARKGPSRPLAINLRREPILTVKETLRALSTRQRGALDSPVPVGTEVTIFSGHSSTQVIAGSTFHTRLVFVMAGSPEIFGPCWMAEVVVRKPGRPVSVVSDWTPAEQMLAKGLAVTAIKGVGYGDDLDVQVGDAELRVWRLAKAAEAHIAETRLMEREAPAPDATLEVPRG